MNLLSIGGKGLAVLFLGGMVGAANASIITKPVKVNTVWPGFGIVNGQPKFFAIETDPVLNRECKKVKLLWQAKEDVRTAIELSYPISVQLNSKGCITLGSDSYLDGLNILIRTPDSIKKKESNSVRIGKPVKARKK
ncbi:hypothetical protein [Parendozoicomonas sp. Alg238-R29]|uniref:hypothetical protein n=1 Tax=Parendozoicomonas sp. Alg238-R29 TaxID=2993446 RepID=UPI00248E9D9D|nr:hypothetical protein [Parendozoicomonas sp. Alg238-R29]